MACSINQDCCTNLVGLRLTTAEYNLCFSHHVGLGKVTAKREGFIYIINSDKKKICPNWKNGGCFIYEDRPLECRLFPYTLYVKKQTQKKAEVRFHLARSCPMVSQLRMTDHAAKTMVKNFCVEAFGVNMEIIVKPESRSDEFYRKFKTFRKEITIRAKTLLDSFLKELWLLKRFLKRRLTL